MKRTFVEVGRLSKCGSDCHSSDGCTAACNKCGSNRHSSDSCPAYDKERVDHPDAHMMPETERSNESEIPNLSADTSLVKSIGDGNCLYQSLDNETWKMTTRKNIAEYIRNSPSSLFHGVPYSDVIKDRDAYYKLMAESREYGGDIEIARNVAAIVIHPMVVQYTVTKE